MRITAHRFTQTPPPSPPRLRQAVRDQTKPLNAPSGSHAGASAPTHRPISSLPLAALFPLFFFFNIHSIIYQRFFQDIRYAARICFCPVVLASRCFPTLCKRCLRDCFFGFSFAKYTTLYSVVDVTKWEKADGSKTKHHFLTRPFQAKAFCFFWNM